MIIIHNIFVALLFDIYTFTALHLQQSSAFSTVSENTKKRKLPLGTTVFRSVDLELAVLLVSYF